VEKQWFSEKKQPAGMILEKINYLCMKETKP
jgi:hypothetical protein